MKEEREGKKNGNHMRKKRRREDNILQRGRQEMNARKMRNSR